MVRDAEATRRRLLDAARVEFASYGIAGARVDRIAENAESNKAQIYHYFGSKEQLFSAVFAEIVAEIVTGIPLDVHDLPGYAARLADGYEKHPDVMRLATWQRLESAGEPPLEAAVTSNREKVAALAKAQADGVVTDRYPAGVLLTLILHLAALWASMPAELELAAAPPTGTVRHELISDVVRALLAT